jgi:hypothetical protein
MKRVPKQEKAGCTKMNTRAKQVDKALRAIALQKRYLVDLALLLAE